MDQTFSFAQISSALAMIHSIAPARMSAFQARLKHYQKMGFPGGINTGRGRAAQYEIGHAIQLAFALEANQMGLNPEITAELIDSNIDRLKVAVGLALFDEKDPLPMFITFDPNCLEALQDSEFNRADSTFNYAGLGQLLENIKRWSKHVDRYAVINISVMLKELFRYLTDLSGRSLEGMREAADTWAHDHGDDSEA